jgi:hypothetical protein
LDDVIRIRDAAIASQTKAIIKICNAYIAEQEKARTGAES